MVRRRVAILYSNKLGESCFRTNLSVGRGGGREGDGDGFKRNGRSELARNVESEKRGRISGRMRVGEKRNFEGSDAMSWTWPARVGGEVDWGRTEGGEREGDGAGEVVAAVADPRGQGSRVDKGGWHQ